MAERSPGRTRSGKKIPAITSKTYTTGYRMPKWNIKPTALHEPKLLKRLLPGWTKADHEDAAEAHRKVGERMEQARIKAVKAGDKKYGGNDFHWVSGGFQEHWPEAVKGKIRRLAQVGSKHRDAARAHEKAMRFRSR